MRVVICRLQVWPAVRRRGRCPRRASSTRSTVHLTSMKLYRRRPRRRYIHRFLHVSLAPNCLYPRCKVNREMLVQEHQHRFRYSSINTRSDLCFPWIPSWEYRLFHETTNDRRRYKRKKSERTRDVIWSSDFCKQHVYRMRDRGSGLPLKDSVVRRPGWSGRSLVEQFTH